MGGPEYEHMLSQPKNYHINSLLAVQENRTRTAFSGEKTTHVIDLFTDEKKRDGSIPVPLLQPSFCYL